MPAKLTQLCQQIAADLNARSAEFVPPLGVSGPPFNAVWGYLPRLDPLETELQRVVVVVPAGRESEAYTRGQARDELRVAVGVARRLPPGAGEDRSDRSDLEALETELLFIEQLVDLFLPASGFYELSAGRAVRVENEPAFDLEQLQTQREFRSVLVVSFEEVRE